MPTVRGYAATNYCLLTTGYFPLYFPARVRFNRIA